MVLEGECITSYDVTALFTSVFMDPAISTIKNKLERMDNSTLELL